MKEKDLNYHFALGLGWGMVQAANRHGKKAHIKCLVCGDKATPAKVSDIAKWDKEHEHGPVPKPRWWKGVLGLAS